MIRCKICRLYDITSNLSKYLFVDVVIVIVVVVVVILVLSVIVAVGHIQY